MDGTEMWVLTVGSWRACVEQNSPGSDVVLLPRSRVKLCTGELGHAAVLASH